MEKLKQLMLIFKTNPPNQTLVLYYTIPDEHGAKVVESNVD